MSSVLRVVVVSTRPFRTIATVPAGYVAADGGVYCNAPFGNDDVHAFVLRAFVQTHGERSADCTHRRLAGFDIEGTLLVLRYFEECFAAHEIDVTFMRGVANAHFAVGVECDAAAVIEGDAMKLTHLCGVDIDVAAVDGVPRDERTGCDSGNRDGSGETRVRQTCESGEGFRLGVTRRIGASRLRRVIVRSGVFCRHAVSLAR